MAQKSKTDPNRPAPVGDVRNRETQHQELVPKLPDETQPAEERGERLATSKAIATSGKEGTVGGSRQES